MTNTNISLSEYIFLKCYSEEMIQAYYKCMPLICEACQNISEIHVCQSSNFFVYWDVAKYFMSVETIYTNVNMKLAKYDLEEMSYHQISCMLSTLDETWTSLIQVIISILNL